jgi:hypothetical protein
MSFEVVSPRIIQRSTLPFYEKLFPQATESGVPGRALIDLQTTIRYGARTLVASVRRQLVAQL